MSYLFESPYLILTVGLLFLAVFGYMFMSTRKKIALVGVGAVVAITLICLAIEHFVETPREQVEASLDKLAKELEANNIEGVLACLDPKCKEGREMARYGMNRYRITKAKVSDLTIVINESTSPPSAEVTFTGIIGAVERKGGYEQQPVPIHFTAKLIQHDRRWLVAEYNGDVGP